MNPLLQRLFRDNQAPISGKALAIGFGSAEELKTLSGRGLSVTGIEKNAESADKAKKRM